MDESFTQQQIDDDNSMEAEQALMGHKRLDGPWSWVMSVLFSICNLLVFGCVLTYGILFPNILKEFNSGRAITAIPGSLGYSMGLFGPIVGRLCDRFGCHKTMLFGGFMCSLALVVASFAPVILILVLSYGLMLCIGIAFVHFSSVLAIPVYFNRCRFEATSIVLAGPIPGLIILTPIVQGLNSAFGWRTTMQFMAGFSVVPCLVGLMMRTRKAFKYHDINNEDNQPTTGRTTCSCSKLIDFSALKIKVFLLATLIYAVVALGHQMPFVHLAKFCDDIGISSELSSWLYFTIGISSTLSRLLVGKFGKSGCLKLPSILLLGIVILTIGNFFLPSVKEYNGMILYCIMYGIGDGIYNTVVVNITIESLPNENKGGGLGLALFFCGLSFLIGPILSGFIADMSGSYNNAFYTAGSLELLGTILCCLFRFLKPLDREQNLYKFDAGELKITERETVL